MESKIVQIIAAPNNLHVSYRNEENPDEPIILKVLCLALTDQGEIKLIDVDDFGCIDIADNVGNFKGIVWRD